MATKWKIISGFLIMVLLLGTVATIGYRALVSASEEFVEYRRLARLNVRFSDILTNQYASSAAVRLFDSSLDPKLMVEAREAIKNAQTIATEAKNYTDLPTTVAILNDVLSRGNAELQIIDGIERSTLAMVDHFTKELLPAAHALNTAMAAMIDAFFATGNAVGSQAAAAITVDLTVAKSHASRLIYSRTQEDVDRAAEILDVITKNMGPIRAAVSTAQERAAFARVEKAHSELSAAKAVAFKNVAAVEKFHADLLEAVNSLKGAIGKNSVHVNSSMDAQGEHILKENDEAESYVFSVALAGVIIGSLLAAFIIWGLVLILRDLSRFADAIAEGDFKAEVRSKEKGEIGAMLTAMRNIPKALQSILDEYQALASKIEHGELEARADPAKYKGSFAALVTGTNTILGRYLVLLENMPSPVLVVDDKFKIIYANIIGRKTIGDDYKGKTDAEATRRDDANSPDDALQRALKTLQQASAETRAFPQGKPMDINYTAIPLVSDGSCSCMLELVTDLTAIKETQRAIQKVTDQAHVIADRLAAASEELSAQVEEVSRGAEMQRTRVESTATAMTEMNSTVLEVARNAGHAADQAEETRSKASAGAELVDKVVRSINLVHTVAATLQTNMQDLGSQAERIGGVLNVISDIADQTNLLALNAAIEAARAGDAGRGFAVVADEVRKLAEKTMTATQEVGASITAIQQSAHTNIKEVGAAASAVDEATALANTSGQALAEIVDLAATNSSVVASIATAAEEQSAASEEINQSVEEINRIVAETTSGMIQAAQAVQDVAQTAQELNRVMGELR